MKKIKFIFVLLIVSFICSLMWSWSYAFADADFDVSYNIIYTINPDGLTHAEFNGVITNKTTKIYATNYTIVINLPDIENIKSYDAKGLIQPTLQHSASGYTLHLVFNNKVVGEGKTLKFTLSFDTQDIAHHEGSIWEVDIPGLANQQDLANLSIHISVPPTFGPAESSKPAHDLNDLSFTKEQLGNSGISIIFGNEQIYQYTLLYHLKNTNLFPIKTTIALPPMTNYQRIILHSLTPKPENVNLDTDGNWIATFYLLPSQKMDVTAKGIALLTMQPKKETLTNEQRKLYLLPQLYWEANNQEIVQKARQLQTPEAIYHYVVSTLHYDFNRINRQEPRLGALSVMNDPRSAVCLEFTDLFIALARAAGIPAREVDGYAYTQHDIQRPLSLVTDILHAWPEYYDDGRQAWVMVDPTWGNTTNGVDYFHQLDLDHFAFVIKGVSSTYPLPAGVYKTNNDQQDKDVNITFGNPTPLPAEQFSFSPVTASKYVSGLPVSAAVEVKNAGSILMQPQTLLVHANDLFPTTQLVEVPAIPPFGSVENTFSFHPVAFLTNRTYPFTIQLAHHSITGYIVATAFLPLSEVILGGICVLFAIIIFVAARKTRRVSVSR